MRSLFNLNRFPEKIRLLFIKYFLLIIFGVNACSAQQDLPKNIIFYIGDGMGLSCITAAKVVKGRLAVEGLPHTAFVTTFPENDDIVTESAAAATALATGSKTLNSYIATRLVSNESAKPKIDTLKTVLEWAEEKGMATGMVVTSSITHATPACFATHVKDRWNETEIAKQLAFKNIEVLLGGGRKFFLPKTDRFSVRKDDLNLIEALRSRGYAVVFSDSELKQLDLVKTNNVVGLFSDEGMPGVPSRSPTLPEMTKTALEILKKDADGFFLMVEGSQIDWMGHDNKGQEMIKETIEFDDAIAVGIEFAKKNPRTLIIVTADHEVGGVAVMDGSSQKRTVELAFLTGDHTAQMVPLFASGPGAGLFHGIIENNFVGQKLIEYVKNRP